MLSSGNGAAIAITAQQPCSPALDKASQTLKVGKEVLSGPHPGLGHCWPVITTGEAGGGGGGG